MSEPEPTPAAGARISLPCDTAATLDRITARALVAGRAVKGASPRPAWTEAAKHRLYCRMFPEDHGAGALSHADT